MARGLMGLAVTVALIAGTAAEGQAQSRWIRAGAIGGVDLTTVALDPSQDFELDGQAVGHAAVLVEFRATDIVGFETRLGWVRTGVDIRDEEASIRVRVDHVSVPMMVRLRAPRPDLSPYGLIGMEVGVKVRAESIATLAEFPEMEIDDPEFNESLRKSNLAINIGGGLEIPLDWGDMLLEGLYSHGVRDLTKDLDPDDPAVRTRQFRLSVGFRF